jgi:hypothetical protein
LQEIANAFLVFGPGTGKEFAVTGIVGGGPFGLKPGQWTDDTSMALCLADSLIKKRGFDPKDQMDRYCRWRNEGYLSSTGTCFDNIRITVNAADSAPTFGQSNRRRSVGVHRTTHTALGFRLILSNQRNSPLVCYAFTSRWRELNILCPSFCENNLFTSSLNRNDPKLLPRQPAKRWQREAQALFLGGAGEISVPFSSDFSSSLQWVALADRTAEFS